jgi:uncharacterized protein YecE (DUF72 family)
MDVMLVGTCGWSRLYEFLPRSRLRLGDLEAYSDLFRVVEVNSSFYEFHRDETYRRWRGRVPEGFEFTIKCHRSITHEALLRPTAEALRGMEEMKDAARACGAHILLLQTPAELKAGGEALDSLNAFFEKTADGEVQLAWEPRGGSWRSDEGLEILREVVERFKIIHVVDPLKDSPISRGETAYFRLHGLPGYNLEYSYTDGDLETLRERVEPYMGLRTYILFNNYAMYRDAYRFKMLLEEGRLPPSPFGPRSILWALQPFEEWPASKRVLLERCGRWRCWVAPDRRVPLGDILKHFDDRVYRSVEEALAEAERIWPEVFPSGG